jgi:uncharacterized protein (DUF4415 family)
MNERKHFGAAVSDDPDDAPELLEAFFEDAEIRQGETIIRSYRGPGRPKAAAPKEQISVRLDQDVLAKLRKAGPGWQSQINALLRQALQLGATRDHVGPPAAPLHQADRKPPTRRAGGPRR